MTLRSKMLVVTSLVCAALLVLAALLIWQMSLASYSQLEKQVMERNLTLARATFQNSLEQLETNTFGYSYWEDTQAFVRGEQPDYLVKNDLFNSPPPTTGMNVFVLSDLQGEVVFARAYDVPDSGKEIEAEVLEALRPYLPRREDDATVLSGAALIAGQPALIVIAPLLDSAGQLPATGTMISVKYLHQDYLLELSKLTGSPLALHILDETAPKAVREANVLWQADPTQLAISTTSNLIQGYFLVPDMVGRPLLAFGVKTQRTIYQQGLKNVLILVATLLVVGVVAVLSVGLLLERVLLSRLSALSDSVRKISENGDVTARVELAGRDELAGLSKDINQMLESLEHQGEALRKSNQELEQFAYVASHDLQEPLRKVQAFSDRLAAKYVDKLDDDGKLYISRMQEATTRMRDLIQDLLSYSRIRSKGQAFVSVDLNEVVRGVISDLEVRLEQSGGRVKLGSLPTVLADPIQMRQVFQNLIGNALKFKKEGVAPVVKIAAREDKTSYTIVVQDNGIGFEQQYEGRVFEIFQRLHGRGEYEGTGMGLAIVKKILERHVGSIRAESEVGEGTRFILTLPKHQGTSLKQTLVEKVPSSKEGIKELV